MIKSVEEILDDLRPKLALLETQRQQMRDKAKKWTLYGAIIAAVGALGFFLHPIVGGIGLIGGLATIFIPRATNSSRYKKTFKAEVMPIIVQSVCPDMTFSSSGSISEDTFEQSRIFLSSPDRYSGEDLFSGNVGKTNMMFSEIHAEERRTTTDSDGNTKTEYETIFSGLFFVTEFHKHFKSETYVLPDFSESWMGRIGRKLQKWNWSRPDLVEMESPEFEKEFVVYGTDQIESRYLITPDMMDRILELKRSFKANVHLSFLSSKLYIAVDTHRDFFEASFSKSLLTGKQVETIVRELQLCISIVEILNLNTRIWTKE